MPASAAKKPPGSGVKPRMRRQRRDRQDAPTGDGAERGESSGRLGWLRKNGIRRVRIAKMTRVWVARDSTNQPERNCAGAGVEDPAA